LTDGLKLFPYEIETQIPGLKNAAIGMDVYPSLLGVGFIVGPKISSYMFVGAILGLAHTNAFDYVLWKWCNNCHIP